MCVFSHYLERNMFVPRLTTTCVNASCIHTIHLSYNICSYLILIIQNFIFLDDPLGMFQTICECNDQCTYGLVIRMDFCFHSRSAKSEPIRPIAKRETPGGEELAMLPARVVHECGPIECALPRMPSAFSPFCKSVTRSSFSWVMLDMCNVPVPAVLYTSRASLIVIG